MPSFDLIGLDFGSETTRGVLVDGDTGAVLGTRVCPYRHGILTATLPDGTPLPPFFALQVADDYLEAAAVVLESLGRDRDVRGIGIGFTASTPLPTLADGTPLSRLRPGDRHAYVKLWKHAAAQPWADRISTVGGDALAAFGGRLSANSLLAKAAEIAEEAPGLWDEAARFIEAADWLVWQLTGRETRSAALAAYKAAFDPATGYPALVADLPAKLMAPQPIGTAAGVLSAAWRQRTGVRGDAAVAVPVIDSHMVVPAVGTVEAGTLVGALGTSAAWLLLDRLGRPLPRGFEGTAAGGVLPGLACHEAGQAGFGDTLGWFVRTFPKGATDVASFAAYEAAGASLRPGETGLLALDWWSGNRVPHADATLSGSLLGLTPATTAAGLYRALMEALGYGARSIVDHARAGGAAVDRIVLTSGLSLASPGLMQIMADILGQAVSVPQREHLTAIGGAVHAAVAAGVVRDFAEGAARLGARDTVTYQPTPEHRPTYDRLYGTYRSLVDDPAMPRHLHALAGLR